MSRLVPALTLLMVGLGVQARANAEPGEMTRQVNVLASIENNLQALSRNLDRLLSNPPDTQPPHGDWTSALNKVSAISHKLEILDRRLTETMDATIDLHTQDPSDSLQAFLEAAAGPQAVAQMMSDAIADFIELNPADQVPLDFLEALADIRRRLVPLPLKLDISYYSLKVKRTIPVRFVQHVDNPVEALSDAQLQAALDLTNQIFAPAGLRLVMSYNITVPYSRFKNLFYLDRPVPYPWYTEDFDSADIVWPLLLPDRDSCPELRVPPPSSASGQFFWEEAYWAQMRAGTYCGRPEEILVYINQTKSNGGQYPWYSRIVGMSSYHMTGSVFPHEIGHYLGLPHTFPGMEAYGLDYNFSRLVGAEEEPDPALMHRYYETTYHLLDPQLPGIAPFSAFWDLVFAPGMDWHLFFSSRGVAAKVEEILQPIEQWGNIALCRRNDPDCEERVDQVRLQVSAAAGCRGQRGDMSDCIEPPRTYYTGDWEISALTRPGSTPDTVQWNLMSYGYDWADGSEVEAGVVESEFISPSQLEQIKRVFQYDVETYFYEGQMGLRPALSVCNRCHYDPGE